MKFGWYVLGLIAYLSVLAAAITLLAYFPDAVEDPVQDTEYMFESLAIFFKFLLNGT